MITITLKTHDMSEWEKEKLATRRENTTFGEDIANRTVIDRYTLHVLDKFIVNHALNFKENESGKFVLYPNPTGRIVHISVPNDLSGNLDLSVYNSAGQLVIQESYESIENTSELQLDLNNQTDGIYFIHLKAQDKIWKQKVILEKNL